MFEFLSPKLNAYEKPLQTWAGNVKLVYITYYII